MSNSQYKFVPHFVVTLQIEGDEGVSTEFCARVRSGSIEEEGARVVQQRVTHRLSAPHTRSRKHSHNELEERHKQQSPARTT